MKDAISVDRIKTLHPKVRDTFTQFIEECENTFDVTVRIVQGLRTFAEQDAIYAYGRTDMSQPKRTAARGGESYHCYGLAIDIVPLVEGKADWNWKYTELIPIAEKYGLTNGKAWNDIDHFEANFGHGPSGWRYFLNLHNTHVVDADGYVIFESSAV